jgi:hypothetical protein
MVRCAALDSLVACDILAAASITVPLAVPTQLLTHHGLSEELASAYLQSTLKLSTDAVGIPWALNVM